MFQIPHGIAMAFSDQISRALYTSNGSMSGYSEDSVKLSADVFKPISLDAEAGVSGYGTEPAIRNGL